MANYSDTFYAKTFAVKSRNITFGQKPKREKKVKGKCTKEGEKEKLSLNNHNICVN